MKKYLGTILFLITLTFSVCADETLTKLITFVEVEHEKELMTQDFKQLPDICDVGFDQWQQAAAISLENSLRQKSISRVEDSKPHPFNTSPLAVYSHETCTENAKFWLQRKAYADYMNNALEDCKTLINFLVKYNNSADEVMPDKLKLARFVIEEQFKGLTRSFLKYLKGEKSTATKTQSYYGSGYIWAWGASGTRKIMRLYNGESVIDASLPFDQQQIIYKEFYEAAFAGGETDQDKWKLVKKNMKNEESDVKQQLLTKVASDALKCIIGYKAPWDLT